MFFGCKTEFAYKLQGPDNAPEQQIMWRGRSEGDLGIENGRDGAE